MINSHFSFALPVSRDRRPKPDLFDVLLRLHLGNFAIYGVYALAEEIVKVVQPLFLSGLVQHFAFQSTVDERHAYLYALGKGFFTRCEPKIQNWLKGPVS